MTNIARERQFLKAQGLDIRYRELWTTQSYTSDRTVSEPVEGFFLHISVTIDGGNLVGDEYDDMRTIQRIGNERFGGIGFPYNSAIFDTGRLYEGQPLTRRGAHTVNDENQPGFRETGSHGSLNYWYRAIVLPQMVTDDVTDAQVHGCAKWAAAQIRAGYAKRDARWYGHRDVSAKSCPGDAGYARLPQIRSLTEHYVRNGLNPPEEDMQADERQWLKALYDQAPKVWTELGILKTKLNALEAKVDAQDEVVAEAVWNQSITNVDPAKGEGPAASHLRWANHNAGLVEERTRPTEEQPPAA